MKVIKWVVIPVVVLGAISFGIYRYTINYASDKLVDNVSQQLVTSGEMEKIKKQMENDPALEEFIKDTETSNSKQTNQETNSKTENNETKNETVLPFHTTEEAVQVVTKKVGMPRLKELAQDYKNGTISKETIIQEVSSKLTADEIKALKIIVYKEVNKK